MRISIYEIIQEAISLFKTNYKLFLSLSLLGSLLSILMTGLNGMVNLNSGLNIVALIAGILFLLYFSIRIQIALVIAVNNRYQQFETSVLECYQTAGSYFWSYILTCLTLGLLIILPIVLIFLSISLEAPIYITVIAAVVFGSITLLLIYFFNFAPILNILNPEVESNFSRSKELVERNPILVVKMLFIGLLTQLLIYFIVDLFISHTYIMGISLATIMEFFIGLFLSPLFVSVFIMVYYQLQNDHGVLEDG